jgi:hypothetical protein
VRKRCRSRRLHVRVVSVLAQQSLHLGLCACATLHVLNSRPASQRVDDPLCIVRLLVLSGIQAPRIQRLRDFSLRMPTLDGWEIDKGAMTALANGTLEPIETFVRAYGPLAALDASRSMLVVLRRYHPDLNCSPDDVDNPSDDYAIGLAIYTESRSTFFRLPTSLTYQSVQVEQSALPASGIAIFDIDIVTAEFGRTRTNTEELMEKAPNYTPKRLTDAQRLEAFRQLTSERIVVPAPIPITSTHITLTAVGELRPSDFPDWWSTTTAIPLVDQALPITLTDFNPQDPTHAARRATADAALSAFLRLGPAERRASGPRVIANCHEFIDAVGEEDWNAAMARCNDPERIWDFVHPTQVYVQWDDASQRMYVTLACECDWETEHGLQLVYRDGATLTRVSAQDGHLTDAGSDSD